MYQTRTGKIPLQHTETEFASEIFGLFFPHFLTLSTWPALDGTQRTAGHRTTANVFELLVYFTIHRKIRTNGH